MMTGFVFGLTYGLFDPFFPNPSSARVGVRGKSLLMFIIIMSLQGYGKMSGKRLEMKRYFL